jgi:hypothetical protein
LWTCEQALRNYRLREYQVTDWKRMNLGTGTDTVVIERKQKRSLQAQPRY